MDNNLSMAGKIRTKEKCPRCEGKFSGTPLFCPTCQIPPKKYFIDLHAKTHGRLRIFSDRSGHPLDSYQRSVRVLETIRYEIDQRIFDPTKYAASDLKEFLLETQIESWYDSKEKEVEIGNLANSYVRGLKLFKESYFLPFFKGMDVREIRTYHIYEFYKKLPQLFEEEKSKNGKSNRVSSKKENKKKRSLKYIKNIMSALENFFNTLHRHDILEKKPSFPVVTLDRKPPIWVDFETQIKIIKIIPKEDRPIFLFLSWQGIRPGEARALKVKDVDLDNGILTIARTRSDNEIKERVKSKVIKPRAINPSLIGLLKKFCKDKHPEAYVFLNPRTGELYSEAAMKRLWKAVNDKGFQVTPYQATRHSLATNLLKNGAHLKSIGDILGHTDIRTTLKYAHGDINNQRMAFKAKGEILRLKPKIGREILS